MSFVVKLNGNNYVSEKTQSAFEEALEEKLQLQPEAPAGGNGNSAYPAPLSPAPEPPPATPVADPTFVLDSLEQGLTHAHEHQQQTLHVHEQYLGNQAEYSRIFSQLMQQQHALFANGSDSPQRMEATLSVLAKLSRSIDDFHAHQAETLSVHNRFLAQQAEYAQAFIRLLRQQCEAGMSATPRTNGNGASRQVVTVAPPQLVAPPVERASAPPAVPAPAPSSAPVSAPEPAAPVTAVPTAPAPADVARLTGSLLETVSEKTGYPAEMLALEMDLEADLGIDSIKRVEILSALQEKHPELPEIETEALAELRTLEEIVAYVSRGEGTDRAVTAPDPAPAAPVAAEAPAAATAPADTERLTGSLLETVSEKTGYPAEMLALEMDLEADLGIDSIKRVEILSALQEKHPELPEIETEALAELRTLEEIVTYVSRGGDAAKKG